MGSKTTTRDDWTRLRFGDIAELINDRVDDPKAAGVDRYVGLEHLDPGSLRVTRWGAPDEVSAQKLRFHPGDIIFGKRRAYQRKVAIADFEGICSAHAMVLRERAGATTPGFLAHFMTSDVFMERAVQISVGSLSPTINWSTLRDQEFDLPPLEHQKNVVNTLAAVLATTDAYSNLTRGCSDLRASLLATFAGNALRHIPLQAACKSPITYGIVQAGPHVNDGVPYIRVSDMTRGDLTPEGMLRTTPELAARFDRSRVEAGDVVVALRGVAGLPAVVPPSLGGANLTQGTAKVSLTDDHDTRYIFWMLQSPPVKRAIAAAAKGSTFKEITLASLRTIEIPVAPLDEQRSIANKIDAVDAAIRHATQRAGSCSAMAVRVLGTLSETE